MIKRKKDEEKIPIGFYLSCERVAGGLSLLVGGIIAVSAHEEEYTELLSHTGRIRVSGKGLELTVFENKSIELKGRIEGINFLYGKV